MKISYNWLRNYIDTQHSPEELDAILTSTGLEVEGLRKVEAVKGGLKGVVIGEVRSCVKHENADKLKVTSINIGKSKELQIVCGAPNVRVGLKVVVATVGSTLYPNPEKPFKIKKAKIRGVESFGMLCAEDELGLGASHDEIMELEDDTEVGQSAADYFNLKEDYCLEIGLTPNRSDALGHLGVARDIVAYNKVNEQANTPLILPDISDYKVRENGAKIKIDVQSDGDCPKYMGCVIENITITDSPDWMKQYLLAIGLKPINNIVDITNFVMHELGTPLHAFDKSEIQGEQIVVKKAKDGETFVTLDGEERQLYGDDLMITDGKKNLCIAGVFGGLSSGVSSTTTSIFLEAACFNPVTVRKTSKRLALSTDASFRFERGVDPNMVEFAMKRAATLIVKYAGGNIVYEAAPYFEKEIKPHEIMFNFENCNRLIGATLSPNEMVSILRALDIEVINHTEDNAKLRIPTYRVDVTREADVVEEVLRIYGFDKVEIPERWKISLSKQNLRKEERKQNVIADLLVSKGYYEMMNNSLTPSQWIEDFGGEFLSNDHSVKMLNPLSTELDVLRQSTIFQGIASIAHNVNRQNNSLALFEFGKTYHSFNGEYVENRRCTLFLTGKKEPEQWNANPSDVSFYSLKGVVVAILERLGINQMVTTKALKKSVLEDGAQLYVQKNKIGEIGWTSSKMNKTFGVKQPVFVADLDWDMLLKLDNRNKVKFQPLPKAFAVRRDFSLLLDKEATFGAIETLAYKVDKKLLKKVNLFDVYEGDKLPEGKKSYAVSFFFQDQEKTLKDQQIDKVMNKIRTNLEQQLNAELR